ncbi:MAG: hypothetical protein DRZ76_00340 [Candidatus Nealsonbacteria bacterium]|nr:MAG: hypothetical protein DRZ76_00340 [Candidatus Nealsonbacteria bacterium]
MDLNEIRQFIEEEGGKFIIVEDGKPVMVVVSFEEYKKRIIEKKNSPGKKAQSSPASRQVLPKELQEEELKVEDLPF